MHEFIYQICEEMSILCLIIYQIAEILATESSIALLSDTWVNTIMWKFSSNGLNHANLTMIYCMYNIES